MSAGVVLRPTNVPPELVDHATSLAGLAYVEPVKADVAALICTRYARFALTTNVGPVVGIWIVLLDAKSVMAVGAASVCEVPDVKPDMVSESNDGTVNE